MADYYIPVYVTHVKVGMPVIDCNDVEAEITSVEKVGDGYEIAVSNADVWANPSPHVHGPTSTFHVISYRVPTGGVAGPGRYAR